MRRAWLRWLPLAPILGLAAALRLHALGEEGLWLDEAMTAEAVRKVPSAMLRFLAADSQFPLFFLIVAARYAFILGADELRSGEVRWKDLADASQGLVRLSDIEGFLAGRF